MALFGKELLELRRHPGIFLPAILTGGTAIALPLIVAVGIGAAGTAIVGVIFLGESREVLRILCIVLIVAGVIGLKFASDGGH